ncbi:MAG: hypothetical protein QOG77_2405, partial [Solirubrobacteraceae bacterium]|nr:hypothetical protein [Solirubrobacteraceae bacterium]
MFNTIVVGVDGREGGYDALRLAAELSSADGADVVALRVIPWDHRPALSSALTTECGEIVLALERELADRGIAARGHVVGDTSPARALHHIAEREQADLIVVGSTHRGRVGRVLVGDVATGTLHGSPCPVAVAPSGFIGRSGTLQRIGVGFDAGEG